MYKVVVDYAPNQADNDVCYEAKFGKREKPLGKFMSEVLTLGLPDRIFKSTNCKGMEARAKLFHSESQNDS